MDGVWIIRRDPITHTHRVLTIDEIKAIHGLTQSYLFVGTKKQIYRQLGNILAPKVIRDLLAQFIYNPKPYPKELDYSKPNRLYEYLIH